eukprot:894272-Rhodomonas_salina.2
MSNVFEAQGRMGFAVRRVGGTDAKVYQPARTLSNPRTEQYTVSGRTSIVLVYHAIRWYAMQCTILTLVDGPLADLGQQCHQLGTSLSIRYALSSNACAMRCPVSLSTCVMRCPVLTRTSPTLLLPSDVERTQYPMHLLCDVRTDMGGPVTVLCICYAVSGTDIGYAAPYAFARQCLSRYPTIFIRACYAMSGTDICYAVPYALRVPTRCPVLISLMLLPMRSLCDA